MNSELIMQLRSFALVLLASLTASVALASPSSAALVDRGTPFVYVALEPGFEAEGFDRVGLGSARLGAPAGSRELLSEDAGDGEPAVSPDGRWIVFSRLVSSPHFHRVLFLVRRDGSGVRQLTDGGPAGSNDLQPSFAPSGKRILFTRLEDETVRGTNQGDIYSVGRDGTGLKQITSGPAADRFPVLSPNGRQLLFARTPRFREPSGRLGFGREHIYSMRLDGSRLRDLTPRINGKDRRRRLNFSASEPDFSPNGRRIFFTVRGATENIYSMRPDGSRLRSLTGVGPHPLSSRFRLSEPAVSPSGRSLLVTARSNYRTEIGFIDLGDPSELKTPSLRGGESPAW